MSTSTSIRVASPPAEPVGRRRRRTAIAVGFGALVVGWAFAGAGVAPGTVLGGANGASTLLSSMLHPDLSPAYLAIVGEAVIETIQIAIVGLVLASVVALPLAVVLAANVGAPRAVRETVRLIAAFTRGVPDLLWALLLVAAIGPGPAAGALALAIHGIGVLAKLWAEQLEAVDERPVEALRLMGTERIGVSLLTILPQARLGLASIALYQAECFVRTSTVLGFVGAGGIGEQLAISLKLFRYEQLATLVIAVVLLILAVDTLSRLIRRRMGATT